MSIDRRSIAVWICAFMMVAAACARSPRPRTSGAAEAEPWRDLLPAPVSVDKGSGSFPIGPGIVIVAPNDTTAIRIARQLAEMIRRATGVLPGMLSSAEGTASGRIVLALEPAGSPGGDEAYDLTIGAQEVKLTASSPAGLFYGVQTIRQLLPFWAEYEALLFGKPRAITLPALHITDRPRFEWRGAMLDVARHFFGVDDVKRYIDLMALYKFNRLHLHLADDQGWRIEIKSWPELTTRGGSREVGGGVGGFFTQDQYRDIVAYAAERFITVVPEIDMPGHTNAGLSSYAELNCSGVAPEPFTGTDVGFSALCVDKDVTYRFIDDVVKEIAALTPGPYFHAGGDEVKTLTPDQYRQFVERVQKIVESHGKRMVGWDEIAVATLLPTSIVQHWRPDASAKQLAASPHLILSPANRLYLDMKYDDTTMLGLNWAGNVSVRQSYDWDPMAASGASADRILGIEAPIWTETLANMRDVEYMAFPRLAAVADLAWAPSAHHDWTAFQSRLAAQSPRWTALGINFRRVPEIAWR